MSLPISRSLSSDSATAPSPDPLAYLFQHFSSTSSLSLSSTSLPSSLSSNVSAPAAPLSFPAPAAAPPLPNNALPAPLDASAHAQPLVAPPPNPVLFGHPAHDNDNNPPLANAELVQLAQLESALSFDFRTLGRHLGSLSPFAALLVLSLLLNQAGTWLPLVLFVATLNHVQAKVSAELALAEQRHVLDLWGWAAVCLVHVLVLVYVVVHHRAQGALAVVLNAAPLGFWAAVWTLTVTSILIRFASHFFDCLLLIAFPPALKRQLQLSRALCALYRQLIPLPIWFSYLNAAASPTDAPLSQLSVLNYGLALMYLALKWAQMRPLLTSVPAMIKAALHQTAMFGRYASSDEVLERGNSCPICFNEFQRPIALPCSHVFCESCITEWFDQERTCPMCRTVVEYAQLKLNSSPHVYLLCEIY